ncbi:MAG: hypothetical protein ACREGH_04210 [Minisyncoccia bacterium]
MDAKSIQAQPEQRDGRLKPESLKNLKRIIERDYGIAISDTEADQFGLSMLKITRLATSAFNRAEEKRLMVTT